MADMTQSGDMAQSADMTPVQDDSSKVTGNVSTELTEAAYRLAAQHLVRTLRTKLLESKFLAARDTRRQDLVELLKQPAGEAVLSFAIAAALELLPTSNWNHVRSHLASNLRIQSYAFLGEFMLGFATEIDSQVELVAKSIDEQVKGASRGEHPKTAASSKA